MIRYVRAMLMKDEVMALVARLQPAVAEMKRGVNENAHLTLEVPASYHFAVLEKRRKIPVSSSNLCCGLVVGLSGWRRREMVATAKRAWAVGEFTRLDSM